MTSVILRHETNLQGPLRQRSIFCFPNPKRVYYQFVELICQGSFLRGRYPEQCRFNDCEEKTLVPSLCQWARDKGRVSKQIISIRLYELIPKDPGTPMVDFIFLFHKLNLQLLISVWEKGLRSCQQVNFSAVSNWDHFIKRLLCVGCSLPPR